MEKSPGPWAPEHPVDFRAPPPSPIAAGRRSSVANEEVLTGFLEYSLRVPDLILPDKFFPRQKSTIITPLKIDYQILDSSKNDVVVADAIIDSVLQTGCFQLINHGIDKSLIRSALARAMGIFRLPNDEKAAFSRSKENNYLWGFEDVHSSDDDVSDMSEEFVWCKDERLQLKMERIWPDGYSIFSEKMETVSSKIEQIAAKIVSFLELHVGKSWSEKNGKEEQGLSGSISYLYKHCRHNVSPAPAEGLISSLRYDVVRMLIRGSDYSHALCFHLVRRCSEFHVYSKKGWVSFCPDKDALIITLGDQIQVSNDGQYKHVIGRPIFNGANQEKEEDVVVSMAIVYSPPNTITSINSISREENTISIGQQLRILILLFLLFQFLFNFL